MNNLLYKEHSAFVDDAHLQNTGGERSMKLFTEADEQGGDRGISARNLAQGQCMNSPGKWATQEEVLGKHAGELMSGDGQHVWEW